VIALVDYGAGNLTSVKKALAAVGAEVFVPTTPGDLDAASGVIVPGVGHFGATRALDHAWMDRIRAHIAAGRPLLGICLGLQWLFEASEEAPDLKGIGIFAGTCRRLTTNGGVKIPHVGWNSLTFRRAGWIADRIPDGAQVYFTHSYAAPVTSESVACTAHGAPFASIVERDGVAGVQFHPEKSGSVGLQVLGNFVARAL